VKTGHSETEEVELDKKLTLRFGLFEEKEGK